jgi:type IV pilus assembly protein PilM
MSQVAGVDIGVGSIKIVALETSGDKQILNSVGEIKNPAPDWIKGENKKAVEEVAKAIKSLWSDLKVCRRQVVTSLPEDEVVSRLIRLPPLKEGEIKDALRFEAETFVPYPLSEVSIDYEIIEQDEAGRLTVFAIASRNKVIETYLKVFKMAGLELNALESPAVAMRRIANMSVSDKAAILLVDILILWP